MAILYLMKTGQTTFEQQDRLESSAGAPLTEQGVRDVREALQHLAVERINRVYTANSEAEQQTAELVREILGLKVRLAEDLRDMDYGLWQGLTVPEIERRQPRIFRRWTDSPTTVCPPDGETVFDAQQRILKAVKSIVKKHKEESILLILRPVMLALLRCLLEHETPADLWEEHRTPVGWCRYELDENFLKTLYPVEQE